MVVDIGEDLYGLLDALYALQLVFAFGVDFGLEDIRECVLFGLFAFQIGDLAQCAVDVVERTLDILQF